MADRTQRLAIVVTAQDLAAGKLKNVRQELAQMGTAGKIASVGLGGAMIAVKKGEQALGNLRNRLTSLAGPLGFIGVTAGLFSLTGAFEQGISKADSMALAVEKISGATGLAAHPASQLVAILEKYGIEADKVVTIAGFEEKALGKLSLTTTKGGASADQLAKANERLHLAEVKLHEIQTKRHSTAAQRLAAQQRVADATRHLTELQGKAATSTNKLDTIEKQYGITLSDTTGKVLPFMTVLNRVADYYKTSTDRAKAGALAAQVFGKGYAALIPVLELGSKGIAEAGIEADKLGLTLKSAQDVQNVHDFIAAQREAKDAIAGLEVQAGLLVMPDLTSVFRGLTSFLSAHQDDVKQFFRKGLDAAEGVAAFITGTVVPTISGLVSAATGFWNAIPAPFRDLLVKGFVADRTIHFLFGMSPGHLVLQIAEQGVSKAIGGALGGLAGGVFSRGSPGNPMFVVGEGIGGAPGPGGGGLGLLGMLGGSGTLLSKLVRIGGGAALGFGGSQLLGAGVERGGLSGAGMAAGGGLGMIAGGAAIAGPIGAIGGSLLAVAQTQQQVSGQSTAMAEKLDQTTKDWLAQSPKKDELQNGLAGVEKGINDLQANPLNMLVQGDALDHLKAMRDAIQTQLAQSTAYAASSMGVDARSAHTEEQAATASALVANKLTALQDQLHVDFRDAIGALRKATDPAAILAAAKRVTADMLGGVGSGKTTQATITDLAAKRDALLAAGDKADAALISAEIRKISPLVAGREHQRQLLAQGDKIVHSSESVKEKVADLHRIEDTLLSEHRTTAAAAIQKQIDILNAINVTTAAVNGIKITIPAYIGPGQTGAHHAPGTGPTAGEGPAGTAAVSLQPGHHLAAGGPALRGYSYLVGEKGPEVFSPKHDGTIIPNHRLNDAGPPSGLLDWFFGKGTVSTAEPWSGAIYEQTGISKGDWLAGKRPGLTGGYHHMARGGPVRGGRSYLVGEKGPERYQDSIFDQLGSMFFGQPRRPAPAGLPFMDPNGAYWSSKQDYFHRAQSSSSPALDRAFTNLGAGIIAAIRQGMAGAKVQVAARSVIRATAIDSRYSNRAPAGGVTAD